MVGGHHASEVDILRLAEKLIGCLDDSLLKPKYKVIKERLQVTGHCYIVTEAIYHLWGRENGYTPHVMRCDDGDTHWFLKQGDSIVDLTLEQFEGEIPDYTRARPCGFLTKLPSKRTEILLERFQNAR